ncbi:hypothetical protein HJG60_007828 [Phyllostomus discolor]|uniref:Uncharacterized protein n=1 Tax=Phyllostomus discolor TaxID=89673 RepID=A0A834ERL5_9CHIR|nr:hypothetical protein HJG60_007828 [Phyllostomus discolor]
MGSLLPVFSPQFQMNGRSNPIINEPDQALIMGKAPPTLPAPTRHPHLLSLQMSPSSTWAAQLLLALFSGVLHQISIKRCVTALNNVLKTRRLRLDQLSSTEMLSHATKASPRAILHSVTVP